MRDVLVAACARTPAPPSVELDLMAGQYVRLVEELVRRDPDSASGDTATSDHASDADTQSRAVDQPRTFDQPRPFDQPRTLPAPLCLPRFIPPRASKQPRALTDVAAEARAGRGILRRSPTMTAAPASRREPGRSPEADQGDAAVARPCVAGLRAARRRCGAGGEQAGERIAFDQELLRLFGVARPAHRGRTLSPHATPSTGCFLGAEPCRTAACRHSTAASVPARLAPPGVPTGARGVPTRHVRARLTMPEGERVTRVTLTGRAVERASAPILAMDGACRREHGVSAHRRSRPSNSPAMKDTPGIT